MILELLLPVLFTALFFAVGISMVSNYMNKKQELTFEDEYKKRLTNLDNHKRY